MDYFESFLKSLASGESPDLSGIIGRKKREDPPLMPSTQTALDIASSIPTFNGSKLKLANSGDMGGDMSSDTGPRHATPVTAPTPDIQTQISPRPQLSLPTQQPAQDVPQQPVDTSTSTRPRLVAGAAVNGAVPQNKVHYDDDLNGLLQQEQDLYKPKVDENGNPVKKSGWAKLGNVLAVAGQSFNKAINGGNDPILTVDEIERNKKLRPIQARIGVMEKQEAYKTAAQKAKLDAQKVQQEGEYRQAQAAKLYGDIDHMQRVDAAAGKKWDLATKNGLLYKKTLDGLEPLVDPKTGQQMSDIQQQNQIELGKPIQRTLGDGTPIYQTGNQAATVEATRENANANRDLQAQTTNANNARMTAIHNSTARSQYEKNNLDRTLQIVKAQADTIGASDQLQGMATQAQSLSAKAQAKADQLAQTDDPKERVRLQKDIDDLSKQMRSLQTQFGKAASSADRTGKVAASLAQLPKYSAPKPVAAPTVKPVKTGAKPVSRTKDPLGLFR